MDLNETDLELIKLVEINPCLYRSKDQRLKKEIWKTIANELRISAVGARDKWLELKRQYLYRRSQNYSEDTQIDKLLSFLKDCPDEEETQYRSVEKPPGVATASTNTRVPTTSTANANNEHPRTTSNRVTQTPSSTTAVATEPTVTANSENPEATSSGEPSATTGCTANNDSLVRVAFSQLAQEVEQLPVDMQWDIMRQFGKMCDQATAEANKPDEADDMEYSNTD